MLVVCLLFVLRSFSLIIDRLLNILFLRIIRKVLVFVRVNLHCECLESAYSSTDLRRLR